MSNYSSIYNLLKTIDNTDTDTNTFDDLSISNDLTIGGNLTVNGSQIVLNTEILTIEDPIIILNKNSQAIPTSNSGIEIERGDSTNARMIWNETTDKQINFNVELWEMKNQSLF